MNLKKLFRKTSKEHFCSAVILAAGSSSRMGTDKILMDLSGVPVIARTVAAFEACPDIREIIIVTRAELLQTISEMVIPFGWTKVTKVITGGATRAHSALCGATECSPKADMIAVHDGARPFATPELISSLISAAVQYRCAVPGIPETDSVKTLDTQGFAVADIRRDGVIRMQTPQVFDADLLKGALSFVVERGITVTDDAAALELLGFPSYVVDGDPDNIKLTAQTDIAVAEGILRKRGVQ